LNVVIASTDFIQFRRTSGQFQSVLWTMAHGRGLWAGQVGVASRGGLWAWPVGKDVQRGIRILMHCSFFKRLGFQDFTLENLII